MWTPRETGGLNVRVRAHMCQGLQVMILCVLCVDTAGGDGHVHVCVTVWGSIMRVFVLCECALYICVLVCECNSWRVACMLGCSISQS